MKFILYFHTQLFNFYKIILYLLVTTILLPKYTNCNVKNNYSNSCYCTEQVKFKLPTLELSGIPPELEHDADGGTEIKCVAPYPLEIFYSSFPSRNFEVKKEISHVKYENGGFYDNRTYIFTLTLELDLSRNLHVGVKNYTIVCRKKNNACIYTRQSFSFSKGKLIVFEAANLTASEERECFFPPKPRPAETNCTAKFFYDKNRNEIWCENADANTNKDANDHDPGESGLVNFDFCTSPDTCAHVFRHRRQIPAKCWTPVDCKIDAPQHCKNGKGKNLTMFKPFIAFCMKKDDTFSWDYSASGPFALRNDLYQNSPKLDFSDAERAEEGIIFMTDFSRRQLLGSRLQIKCSALAYFSSASFQFAVEMKSNDEGLNFNSSSSALDLVFLPVSPNSTYEETLHLYSQVYTIPLDSLKIQRVYCFVGQRSSFNWFNASRSLQIYDVLEFYALDEMSCSGNSSINQNKKHVMKIHYMPNSSGMKKHEFSEETPLFQKLVNEIESVKLYCIADFPIQIRHELNSIDGAIPMEKSNSVKWTTERHFDNKSAQEFEIGGYVNLQWHRQFFRCESIENPCVQKTILYELNERENSFNFSLVTKFPTFEPREMTEDDDGVGECDADFYYRRTKNWDSNPNGASSYEFCCKFPLNRNEVAQVNFYNCDSFLTCSNLFPRRRRDKKCWKFVPKESSNGNCTEFVKYMGASPFLATCSSGSSKNGDYFETDFGSFALFGTGISKDEKQNESLSIYFDENDVKSEEMITLANFDPYQFVNETFTVRCHTSPYFTTGQILFGFELDEPQKQAPHFYEAPDSLKMEQDFKTGTEQSGRIICTSPLINKRQWVNSSRPFHIYARQNLEIFISEDEIEIQKDEIQVKNLAVNKTVTCHALGYPPAQISWKGPLGAVFNETRGMENVSHVWSRIDFPKIYPNFDGLYNCTALNSMNQTRTKSLFLRVKVPSFKVQLIISMATLFLFLIIGAIFLARYFLRLKKEVARFKREHEKFMMGDPDPEGGDSNQPNPNLNDPHSEIWKLPFDKKLVIPEDLIEMNRIKSIGKGQFGVVYEGFVIPADENEVTRDKIHVAVKTLKRNADYLTLKAFHEEIKIMSYIGEHENVVKLIGVCTEKIEKRQILVCVEYCQHSDLLHHLWKNRSTFWDEFNLENQPSSSTPSINLLGSSETINSSNPSNREYDKISMTTTALLNFAAEIANGMDHLASKNVIHGDLAARNILLSENYQVKISDFGLSRQLLKPAIYAPKCQGFIPWAWRAIETLTGDCSYSVKSDVWSYAVVLVEIFGLGAEPYPHLKGLSKDFVDFLRDGGRPQRPKYANDQLYELMNECWRPEPENRPSFSEIRERIRDLSSEIRAKHQLNTFDQNLRAPNFNLN